MRRRPASLAPQVFRHVYITAIPSPARHLPVPSNIIYNLQYYHQPTRYFHYFLAPERTSSEHKLFLFIKWPFIEI